MKEIPLYGRLNGKKNQIVAFAKVDDGKFDFLNNFHWHYRKTPKCRSAYAITYIKGRGQRVHFFMHRLVIGLTRLEKEIDHSNANGLDNQRHNLTLTTRQGNCENLPKWKDTATGLKGVYPAPKSYVSRPFYSKICIRSQMRHIGYFATATEAALAYDAAARKFRPTAPETHLNFPMEELNAS